MAKRKTGMTAVQLDIAKVFDTIPQRVTGDALQRKGIPEVMIELVEDSYKSFHTTIRQGCWQVPVNIRRGVKQGDLLSPFIFNAVLEPLLLQLEEMQGFQISNDIMVSSFTFADDIILVLSTASGTENLLRKTKEYLRGCGMTILAQKCAAFSVNSTWDSWHLLDPGISSANSEKIPFTGAETSLRYLGSMFSPWKGVPAENLDSEFRDTLEKVKKLSLKLQ
jgi:hypothetical protein